MNSAQKYIDIAPSDLSHGTCNGVRSRKEGLPESISKTDLSCMSWYPDLKGGSSEAGCDTEPWICKYDVNQNVLNVYRTLNYKWW